MFACTNDIEVIMHEQMYRRDRECSITDLEWLNPLSGCQLIIKEDEV